MSGKSCSPVLSQVAAVLLIIGTITVDGAAGVPKTKEELLAQYYRWMREEQEWIVAQQLPEGPIPLDRNTVMPYFGNFATYGLMVNEESGHRYGENVRRHLQWYIDHINRPDRFGVYGTVYDYMVAWNGKLVSKENYDSSDSYAATFISALRRYAEATGDYHFVIRNRQHLQEIVGAIEATLMTDGLTWAKIDYPVRYLMDNSEVYAGWRDLAWLYRNVLGDEAKAAYYDGVAEKARSAMERRMWKGDRYSMAIDNRGVETEFSWDKWLFDATAQMFAIWNGVVDPKSERARQLYAALNAHHPEWMYLGFDDVFAWAAIGYTAALVGDYDSADAYVRSVRAHYINSLRRAHPWHPSDASFYVLTLYELARAVEEGRWSGPVGRM